MQKEIAIVYMVAGLSSRFGGKLKQFAQVGKNGETLIEVSMQQALNAGFTKIVFIVGKLTEKPFKDKFGSSYEGIPILYAKQNFDEKERDKPWGTVDALCSASEVIDCDFIVCNGDDIYGENTFRILVGHLRNEREEAATVGYELGNVLSDAGGVNRGVYEINDGFVEGIEEVFNIRKDNLEEKGLSTNTLVSMNVFALPESMLSELCGLLNKFKLEHHGDRKIECLLPNELTKLIDNGNIKMRIYSTSDRWIGVTNPEDEIKVREILSS